MNILYRELLYVTNESIHQGYMNTKPDKALFRDSKMNLSNKFTQLAHVFDAWL